MLTNILKKLKNEDKKLIEEGNVYYNNEEYLKAIEKYEEALSINQNTDELKEKIANCKELITYINGVDTLYKNGDLDGAKELCNKISLINEKSSYSKKLIEKINNIKKLQSEINSLTDKVNDEMCYHKLMNKLSVLEHIDNTTFIIDYIKKVKKEANKKKSEHIFKKGINYYHIGAYHNALEKFKLAVKLCDKSSDALKYYNKTNEILKKLNEGNKLYIRGLYEESLIKYIEVLEIVPNDKNIIHNKNIVERIINLKNKKFVPSKYGNLNRILNYYNILKYNPYDKIIRETINNDINEYFNSIQNINIENYSEIFEEIKKLNNINLELYNKYIEEIKKLIEKEYSKNNNININNNVNNNVNNNINNAKNFLKLIIHYWKVICGDKIHNKIKLPNELKIIKLYNGINRHKVIALCKNKNKYTIICINIEDNTILWENTINIVPEDIFVNSNELYVVSEEKLIESISLYDGSTLWRTVIGNLPSHKKILPLDIDEHNNILIVICESNGIYCLNKKTGIVLWSYSITDEINTIEYSNEYIFITTYSQTNFSNAYMFNLNSGLIWEENYDELIKLATFNVKNNEIYLVDENNNIISINIKTAMENWRYYEYKNEDIISIKYLKINNSLQIFSKLEEVFNNEIIVRNKLYCLDLDNIEEFCYYNLWFGEVILYNDISCSKKNMRIIGNYISKYDMSILNIYNINLRKLVKKYNLLGKIQLNNIKSVEAPFKNKINLEKIISANNIVNNSNYMLFNEINPIDGDLLNNIICSKNAITNCKYMFSKYLIDFSNNEIYIYYKNKLDIGARIYFEDIDIISKLLKETLLNNITQIENYIIENCPNNKNCCLNNNCCLNKKRINELIHNGKEAINNNQYLKAYESIIKLYEIISLLNIDLKIEFLENTFKINVRTDFKAIIYNNSNYGHIYDLAIKYDKEDIEIRTLEHIEELCPGESKEIQLSILPKTNNNCHYNIELNITYRNTLKELVEKKLNLVDINIIKEEIEYNENNIEDLDNLIDKLLDEKESIIISNKENKKEEDLDILLDKLLIEKEEINNIDNENHNSKGEEELNREELLKKLKIRKPDDDEIDRLLENL